MLEAQKVFSLFGEQKYNELFPFIKVLDEYDFFLVCNAYDIAIPQEKKLDTELNIFETTVLRFLNIGYLDDSMLADKMCVGEDFIKIIVSGLTERGYLAPQTRTLTHIGQKAIATTTTAATETEYLSGMVFSLKGSQELLPLICVDKNTLLEADINSQRKSVTMRIGTAEGNMRTRVHRYYYFGNNTSYRPSKAQVYKVLNNYSHRLISMEGLNASSLVVGNVSSVFIHLKAVIQDGNVDELIISDGRNMHNQQLAEFLFQNAENFKEQRINHAVKICDGGSTSPSEDYSHSPYFKIEQQLRKIELKKGVNLDQIGEAERSNKRNYIRLHAAIEWALHYYLMKNPPPEEIWNSFLDSGFRTKNNTISSLVLDNASKIGFRIKKQHEFLFKNFTHNNIARYHEQLDTNQIVPNLYVQLPLCILEAVNNPGSSWYEIKETFPDIFSFIATLNYVASQHRHEGATTRKNGHQTFLPLEEANITVTRFIKLLLPDFQAPSDKLQNSAVLNDYSMLRLQAYQSVCAQLSSHVFEGFPKEIREILLTLAPSRDEECLNNKDDFYLKISSVLEYIFKHLSTRLSLDPLFSCSAAKNIVSSVLQEPLPDSLKYVRQEEYGKAQILGKGSLGAYLLLWAANDDSPYSQGEALQKIVACVNNILLKRGHGNSTNQEITLDVIRADRTEVYEIIKLYYER